MKRVIAIIISAVAMLGQSLAETRLEYSVSGTTEEANIIWSIETRTTQTVLSLENENRFIRIICDSQMNTREWLRRDQNTNTNLTAKRTGQEIYIKEKLNGELIEKHIEIDDGMKWYQSMNHQFGRFAVSGKNRETFLMLRPDTLEASQWILTRKAEEPVTVNGKIEETVRVRLTVKNVPAFVWKAELWYRISDGRFLRYRGPMVGPGASEVTTSLVEEVPAI